MLEQCYYIDVVDKYMINLWATLLLFGIVIDH
jgi:hypothetical protein